MGCVPAATVVCTRAIAYYIMPNSPPRLSHVQGVKVNRPRAADDFEVIRERLEELRREREEIEDKNKSGDTAGEGESDEEAERRRQERCDGAPPAWVPTIFLPQPTD
jgi:hypothetical protein